MTNTLACWPNTVIRRDSCQTRHRIAPHRTETKQRIRESLVQSESSPFLARQLQTDHNHPLGTRSRAHTPGPALRGDFERMCIFGQDNWEPATWPSGSYHDRPHTGKQMRRPGAKRSGMSFRARQRVVGRPHRCLSIRAGDECSDGPLLWPEVSPISGRPSARRWFRGNASTSRPRRQRPAPQSPPDG